MKMLVEIDLEPDDFRRLRRYAMLKEGSADRTVVAMVAERLLVDAIDERLPTAERLQAACQNKGITAALKTFVGLAS